MKDSFLLTSNIYNIGVNDHNIDLFESQYVVKNGMRYNSYVIMDDKIAVIDTIDKNFKDEWLNKLGIVLDGKKPDYLIIHHMEPDHSANIVNFMKKYPATTIVSSARAFQMMTNFFGDSFDCNKIVVSDNDVLELGKHKLRFVSAQMVHWPEVIMSYEECSKTLFSADAFGKFGANDIDEPWLDEARRYYYGIVGNLAYQFKIF